MPSYNRFESSGYLISVNPTGWRKIFHCPRNIWEAPYFVGNRINLKLKVCQNREHTPQLSLQLYRQLPEDGLEARKICDVTIEDLGIENKQDIEVISRDIVATTGDGFFSAIISSEGLPNFSKSFPQVLTVDQLEQKIMTFHAYPSEKIFFAVFGFILPLIGGVIGWFIKSWLTHS
jgi:hypothetical protein